MIELHCSALPRVLSCPASLTPPTVRIDGENVNAAIGNAVHRALAMHARGDACALESIALEFGVKAKDFAALYYIGLRALEEYRVLLGVAVVEEQMRHEILPDVCLVGTPDLRWTEERQRGRDLADTRKILDWKTGSVTANHRDQIIGYHWNLGCEPGYVRRGILVWLRDPSWEEFDVTQEDLDALPGRISESIDRMKTYNPTPGNCAYCPRVNECPARMALVQRSVMELSAPGDTIKAMTTAALADRYDAIRMIEGACKTAREILRERIQIEGPVVRDDGKLLSLDPVEKSEILPTEQALGIIRGAIGLPGLLDSISIGKGALADAISVRTEKGKGRAIKAVMDELDAAGAVEKKTEYKLTLRKGE